MDKIFISNEIKAEILRICGISVIKPYNLAGATPLFKLNKNEIFCRELEMQLQHIATKYQTGKTILQGEISHDYTVNQCIKLVFAE